MTKKQIAAVLRKAKKACLGNEATYALFPLIDEYLSCIESPVYMAFVKASGAQAGEVGYWQKTKTRRQVLAAFDRAIRAQEKPRAQKRGRR